jgi:hypothetical protein
VYDDVATIQDKTGVLLYFERENTTELHVMFEDKGQRF